MTSRHTLQREIGQRRPFRSPAQDADRHTGSSSSKRRNAPAVHERIRIALGDDHPFDAGAYNGRSTRGCPFVPMATRLQCHVESAPPRLQSCLSERKHFNQILQKIIDEGTDPWGIDVTAVEIKDIDLPQEMRRAMARQAEAGVQA